MFIHYSNVSTLGVLILVRGGQYKGGTSSLNLIKVNRSPGILLSDYCNSSNFLYFKLMTSSKSFSRTLIENSVPYFVTVCYLKSKYVSYSSQGSGTVQIDFYNCLSDVSTRDNVRIKIGIAFIFRFHRRPIQSVVFVAVGFRRSYDIFSRSCWVSKFLLSPGLRS